MIIKIYLFVLFPLLIFIQSKKIFLNLLKKMILSHIFTRKHSRLVQREILLSCIFIFPYMLGVHRKCRPSFSIQGPHLQLFHVHNVVKIVGITPISNMNQKIHLRPQYLIARINMEIINANVITKIGANGAKVIQKGQA